MVSGLVSDGFLWFPSGFPQVSDGFLWVSHCFPHVCCGLLRFPCPLIGVSDGFRSGFRRFPVFPSGFPRFPVGFPLFSTCLLRSVAVSYLLPAVSSGFPYVAVWLSVLK